MKSSLTGFQTRTILASVAAMAAIQIQFYAVNVVLPSMGKDLNVSSSELEWILNAQLLAFAAPIIAIGRLSDLVGHRRMGLIGTLGFGITTFCIGLLSDPSAIIALRALQGAVSGLVTVTTVSYVSKAMTQDTKALGIGLFTSGFMATAAIGPLFGGLIVDMLSWRWVFFINGVIALAAWPVILAFVQADEPKSRPEKFDIAGFVTLTAGTTLGIFGLQLTGNLGWSSFWPLLSLVAAVFFLVLFYRLQKTATSPLIDFALFRNRNFFGACLFSFLSGFPVAALLFVLSLYLQFIVGISAVANGVILLAMMIPLSLSPTFSQSFVSGMGGRLTLAVSMALSAFCFVFFAFARPEFGLWLPILALILLGSGRGLMMGTTTTLALASIPPEKSAAAAGTLQFIRNLAYPVGVAITAPFFRNWENIQLGHMLELAGQRISADDQADIKNILSGSDIARDALRGLAPKIADRVDFVVDQAFMHGLRNVMFLSLAVSVLGLLSVFIVEGKRRASRPQEKG